MKRLLFAVFILGSGLLMMGFDLNNTIIPESEIASGGVPKDGIPAISDPQFVIPENANHLDRSDHVIGIEIDGISKAYPIKILNWGGAEGEKRGGRDGEPPYGR